MLPVATGAALGLLGAILTRQLLDNLIDGAKSADPATLVFTILLILVIASASIWAGSRRIADLDIMEILRVE